MTTLAPGPLADSARPRLRTACVTVYDASDVIKWPKVGAWSARALSDHGVDVSYVGPLQLKYSWYTRPKEIFHNQYALRRRAWPYPTYFPGRDRVVVRQLGRQVDKRLSTMNVDVVFSPESPWSQPVAYLKTERPIVIWTDTTFAGVINFYPNVTNLSRETLRDARANESAVLRRSDRIVFSSTWAAQQAIDQYSLDATKVSVVPYGPAAEILHGVDEVEAMIQARPSDRCTLLFLATNWTRKGGATALAVAQALNAAGLPTTLVVAGCEPAAELRLPSFVEVDPWVDKRSPAGQERFHRLLAEAHFLILPTVADCTPLVLNEAAAYGLPCLTSDVGGIKTIITDGRNGKTFPLESDPIDYANFMLDTFADIHRYRALASTSFEEYQCRLNWDTAGRAVARLMAEAASG